MTLSETPAEVVDDDGRVWRLDRRLGTGGQGDVYSVPSQPLAVKVLHDDNPVARAALQDRLRAVRRLPLQDIPIASPLVLLARPHTGYVMKLIDGVQPLDDLRPSPRVADVAQWYFDTGGLRRRLRVLARLADALDHLHSRAIVYGDLSLANVLISEDKASDVVWLIDPDNLRYSSAPGRWIMTPHFGAPELHRRTARAPTTLTDAHSLAVIVYEILTLKHPLLGGVLVDENAALEERAFRGELPWVAHPDDDRNEQLAGLPWPMVLTRRAFDLARRTFEAGLSDAKTRPSAGEWARELRWASGMCLECQACEQTFLAGARNCPWCGTDRPRVALVTVAVCSEQGQENRDKRLPHLVCRTDDAIVIRRFEAFGDRDLASQGEVVATVRLDGDRLLYEPQVDGTLIGKGHSELRPIEQGRTVPITASGDGMLPWVIHFGEPGSLHRIARLQLVAGGRN